MLDFWGATGRLEFTKVECIHQTNTRTTGWLSQKRKGGTWRIIPLSKQLVTPSYKPWNGRLEGEQPHLGDLLVVVTNQ